MIIEGGLVVEKDAPHLAGFVLSGDPGSFSPVVWHELSELYDPGSVIDLGSGIGAAARWFAGRGIEAFAVDGSPAACALARAPGIDVREHDFTKGSITLPARQPALCWSSEFVEHVEERFADNFLRTMSACHVVAMTHAPPGQVGHHHVNCQPAEYWVEKAKGVGLRYEKNVSEYLRSRAEPTAHYVRNTLLVFEREGT